MTITYRPRNRVVTFAAPAGPLVSLADMKEHLRVDHGDEDDLITAYAAAAVSAVERATQRLLTAREAVLRLPGLPYGRTPIELPGGEVSALASVVADGNAVTGASVVGHSPALLVPGADWPVLDAEGYPVTITYTAGFIAAPGDLIAAVKLICGSLYEQRQNSESTAQAHVPISAEYLMRPHRIAPA